MRSPVVPLLPMLFLVFRSPFHLTFLDPQQGKLLLLLETILENEGGKPRKDELERLTKQNVW